MARLKQLLASGASPSALSAKGHTPLQLAALHGRADAAEVLLRAGASVNAAGPGPWKYSFEDQSHERHGLTPLHLAAIGGHVPMIELLAVDWRASHTAGAAHGTPLHYASAHADPAPACALLRGGACITALDKDGDAPLVWAAELGRATTISALLEAGAPVNAVGKHGFTALHCAAVGGYAAALQALLAAKADVNKKGENSLKAMHMAAWGGHVEAMKTLLAAGASSTSASDDGIRPLHLAASSGNAEAVRLLLKVRGWQREGWRVAAPRRLEDVFFNAWLCFGLWGLAVHTLCSWLGGKAFGRSKSCQQAPAAASASCQCCSCR